MNRHFSVLQIRFWYNEYDTVLQKRCWPTDILNLGIHNESSRSKLSFSYNDHFCCYCFLTKGSLTGGGSIAIGINSVFFFWVLGPFKNISLISSRSLTGGGSIAIGINSVNPCHVE